MVNKKQNSAEGEIFDGEYAPLAYGDIKPWSYILRRHVIDNLFSVIEPQCRNRSQDEMTAKEKSNHYRMMEIFDNINDYFYNDKRNYKFYKEAYIRLMFAEQALDCLLVADSADILNLDMRLSLLIENFTEPIHRYPQPFIDKTVELAKFYGSFFQNNNRWATDQSPE